MTGSSHTEPSDRRQATILFADISGFAALSREVDPEDVTAAVNACFEIIERVVLERGGTMDKYIGDCAMALFGAPRALEHAPRQALNAAIEIRNQLQAMKIGRGLTESLDVHIGVNTGLVVSGGVGGELRRDYTVMGSSVNLAERLQAAAGAGEIFVGAATYRATARDFNFRALKPLRLKGIDEPIEAYELISTAEQIYRVRPQTESKELVSPMVGRENELAIIAGAISTVAGGQGGIVNVIGEHGVGKSRLLAEARKLDGRGQVTLLEARSLSMGGSLSFHPFVDMVRSWAGIAADADEHEMFAALVHAIATVPLEQPEDVACLVGKMIGLPLQGAHAELFVGVEGEALERLIHRNVRDLIAGIAVQRPLAIVFEDLHWADQSSLALLEALLPVSDTLPVLFVNVFRPGYESTSERVLNSVEAAHSLRHIPVRLDPLSGSDCDALVRNLVGNVELPYSTLRLIENRTEGNPFYIEEVMRSLVEQGALVRERHRLRPTALLGSIEIPGTVQEVIMARVDRLEPAARAMLQMASVVGRRFYRRIVERIVPDGIDLDHELQALIDKQFVGSTTSRRTASTKRMTLAAEVDYVFKHALVQETVYASLLKRTRRELHAKCATAIEEMFAERIQDAYGMLAYHWVRADEPVKAEEYMFKAGAEAAKNAASAEALQYFRDAYQIYVLVHGDDADAAKKAQLEKNIGLALFNTGKLTESIEHFDAALELHGLWVPRSRTALWLKFAVDLPAVLIRLYADWAGRDRGRDRAIDRDLMTILFQRARAENPTDPQRYVFDTVAAMRYVHRLKPSSVDRGCGMYSSAGVFFAFGGVSFAIARRFLDGAAKLAQARRPTDEFQYKAMYAVLDFHCGDWRGDRDMSERLLQQGLRGGLLFDADTYLGMVAERDIHQGRFERAREQITLLEELSTKHGYDFARSNEYAMKAFLATEERRLDDARDAVKMYYDTRHEDTLRTLALSLAAKIDVLDGRLDAAECSLLHAAEILRARARMPPFYEGAYHSARLGLELARLEAAAGQVSRAAGRQARRCTAKALGVARKIARERVECYRLGARVYERLGEHARALKLWQSGLESAAAMSAQPEFGRTCADLARFLREGERLAGRDASHYYTRACEIFDDLKLTWDLERIDHANDARRVAATESGARGYTLSA